MQPKYSALLGLVPSALALVTSTKTNFFTHDLCTTAYSSKSANPVPTTTTTKSLTPLAITILSTTTPVETVTPEPVTIVDTAFETSTVYVTAEAVTDVFSSTSTILEYTTTTTTSTFTTTTTSITSTTTTATTTVPTSAGFLPVADTTATAYPRQKRWVGNRVADVSLQQRGPLLDRISSLFNFFPASVGCTEYVDVIKTVVILVPVTKPKTVTLAPVVVSSTSTSTITVTSTAIPDEVSTTLTFSTTSTIPVIEESMATATATASSTVVATTTTSFYAACATNNVVGPRVSGGIIDNVTGDVTNNFVLAEAASGYDCCVACITGSCKFAAFDTLSSQCFIFSVGTCPNGQLDYRGRYTYEPVPKYFQLTVSNGNCGYLYDGGVRVL